MTPRRHTTSSHPHATPSFLSWATSPWTNDLLGRSPDPSATTPPAPAAHLTRKVYLVPPPHCRRRLLPRLLLLAPVAALNWKSTLIRDPLFVRRAGARLSTRSTRRRPPRPPRPPKRIPRSRRTSRPWAPPRRLRSSNAARASGCHASV